MSAKKKAKSKKKLDGKKLAAMRKPRDSAAQFIKDELNAGRNEVAKIVAKVKDNFPKCKVTPGYVNWIAKTIGKKTHDKAAEKAAEKAAA